MSRIQAMTTYAASLRPTYAVSSRRADGKKAYYPRPALKQALSCPETALILFPASCRATADLLPEEAVLQADSTKNSD
ncbi:MAG: hypothetical protein IKS70_01760 [Bacteroides sp.]|nr:hypothetical protein [Bacteroides sp.]